MYSEQTERPFDRANKQAQGRRECWPRSLRFQQLRQLGDLSRDPPRLVVGQHLRYVATAASAEFRPRAGNGDLERHQRLAR